MAMPQFSMRQLLEAGVHFGHHTRRWNPKMAPYLYGARNNIHIIDLQQTVPLLDQALSVMRDVAAGGGRVLFVATKRQAADKVAEYAKRCGQYYVNHRWLGGMLTNWQTISHSIRRLRELEGMLDTNQGSGFTKRELLFLTREREKLDRALGGIKDMGGLPDILFVLDVNKDDLAVQEATKLNIPVVAVIDSNSDPRGIQFPIPGNDDALRAISLYLELMSAAILDGLQKMMMSQGVDIGAEAEPQPETLPEPEAEALMEAEAQSEPEAQPDSAEGEAATDEIAAALETAAGDAEATEDEQAQA
ncbi:MAG: 30S ribosomal protein S2 [Alphaproteobacteria bacterium]